MCTVSDKIKFCTCNTKDIAKAKHIWTLRRYVGFQGSVIMGEIMPPYQIDEETDMHNRKLLLQRINESGVGQKIP
jgi:hypothetical protein